MFLFVTLLFFVLTPGIVVTLPPKSNKYVVAGFHGIVFSLVWYFTYKLVWDEIEGPASYDGPTSTYGTTTTRFQ